MPCVCLANTFARWKSLKAQKVATSNADTTVPQATPQVAEASLLVDGAKIKVPHVRKTFAASQLANTSSENTKSAETISPQSTSGVMQPIFTRRGAKIFQIARRNHMYKSTVSAEMPNVSLGRPAVRLTRADLINAESRLGSTIFGPIPAGHRREFFHDRNNVWIWHEDWHDGQNNPHQMTVRYEVRTTGIYKKVSSGKYLKLEGDELENFRKATHAYLDVIKKNLYNRPKLAGSMI